MATSNTHYDLYYLVNIDFNWFHKLTCITLIDIQFLFALHNFTLSFPFQQNLVPYECISSIVMNSLVE